MTTTSRRRTRSGVAIAAAAGAIGIWSLNATAGGAALEHLSVLQVLALQFGGAFVVLVSVRVARRGGARRLPARRAMAIGVIGFSGTMILQYVAFASAPLVAANAIAYSWPLLATAWIALASRGSRLSLAFAVIGFGGVVLLFASRGGGGSSGTAPVLGYVAALGSAVCMAGYTLTAGPSMSSTGDLLLAGSAVGVLATAPAALLEGARWAPWWALALSLAMGIAMMAVGYALWTLAMAHPTGARLAPLAYATPLLSTLVLLATGQRLNLLGLVGCGLIVLCCLGVVIDALRPNRPATGRIRAPRTGRAVGWL